MELDHTLLITPSNVFWRALFSDGVQSKVFPFLSMSVANYSDLSDA